MADRATIKTSALRFLGAKSDDPFYSDTILDPIVQEAVDSLLTDINEQNPDYNQTVVTLTAASTTSNLYALATQSPAVTDFSAWRQIRALDDTGIILHEVRYDELREAGVDHFALSGIDSAVIIETSSGTPKGQDLWMRYTIMPAVLTVDGDVPGGIPLRFHDVIALEMLFAFALGGEQALPRDLHNRWFDRRNQLMRHVGQRGAQPSRTRMYGDLIEHI